jgi:hypothetical protein
MRIAMHEALAGLPGSRSAAVDVVTMARGFILPAGWDLAHERSERRHRWDGGRRAFSGEPSAPRGIHDAFAGPIERTKRKPLSGHLPVTDSCLPRMRLLVAGSFLLPMPDLLGGHWNASLPLAERPLAISAQIFAARAAL